jgi:biopolymer transport protein TolR
MEIKRTSKKMFSDLNLVPLIDVSLGLLIIFMVAAPMLEQGIQVNLPSAKAGTLDKQKKEEPVVISVKEDQSLYINNQKIPFANLDTRINLLFRTRNDKNVFVKADEKLPYGFVAGIISKLKEGGAERIGLVTQPSKNINE